MSSKAREAEKKLQWEAEQERVDIVRRRKEALTMYWRIDEAETIDDIKDILERLREHLGIE